jgi:hypothetical protein
MFRRFGADGDSVQPGQDREPGAPGKGGRLGRGRSGPGSGPGGRLRDIPEAVAREVAGVVGVDAAKGVEEERGPPSTWRRPLPLPKGFSFSWEEVRLAALLSVAGELAAIHPRLLPSSGGRGPANIARRTHRGKCSAVIRPEREPNTPEVVARRRAARPRWRERKCAREAAQLAGERDDARIA